MQTYFIEKKTFENTHMSSTIQYAYLHVQSVSENVTQKLRRNLTTVWTTLTKIKQSSNQDWGMMRCDLRVFFKLFLAALISYCALWQTLENMSSPFLETWFTYTVTFFLEWSNFVWVFKNIVSLPLYGYIYSMCWGAKTHQGMQLLRARFHCQTVQHTGTMRGMWWFLFSVCKIGKKPLSLTAIILIRNLHLLRLPHLNLKSSSCSLHCLLLLIVVHHFDDIFTSIGT